MNNCRRHPCHLLWYLAFIVRLALCGSYLRLLHLGTVLATELKSVRPCTYFQLSNKHYDPSNSFYTVLRMHGYAIAQHHFDYCSSMNKKRKASMLSASQSCVISTVFRNVILRYPCTSMFIPRFPAGKTGIHAL